MSGHLAAAPRVKRLVRAIPLAAFAILTTAVFRDGLVEMAGHWGRAEYSHGYLIPLVAIAMVLQCAQHLDPARLRASWSGPVLLFVALATAFIGELSTIYPLIQYAFLVAIGSWVLSQLGWHAVRRLAPALAFLVFMIPMPQFFFVMLTARLQLISSALGVALIRIFDIPVFLSGNVIDLGLYQLQVAEACSGLRYLFPLASFAYLVAYLYRGPMWQRAILFVSAIPIALLMNGARIAVIGVTVDRFGIQAAEGFIHYFEGWTVFALCLGLLFCEAALLARMAGPPHALLERLAITAPDWRKIPWGRFWVTPDRSVTPMNANIVLVMCALAALSLSARRAEIIPPRTPLVLFPTVLGGWRGSDLAIEPQVLDRLQLSDYLMRDYTRVDDPYPVNLYVAYYASQRKGASVHSPHNCIPAGGWEIERTGRALLPRVREQGPPLAVNRVIIGKAGARALVYYYFDQRGRELTEEYQAKWFILVDALARNRTDGALIRLVTEISPGEPIEAADHRLETVLGQIVPHLDAFIPR